MTAILAGFGLIFSAGAYFILAELFHIPKLAVTRAVLNVARRDRKKQKRFETAIFEVSVRLSRFIKLDPYKRRKTEALLKTAGITLMPETFYARALVKAGLSALGVIPSLLIFPIFAPVFVFLAIAIYFKEIKSADDAIKKRREEIENELPRFVATVAQELRANRDVLSFLEKYKRSAGPGMKAELEVTIADMQSGNLETALVRFESRLNSTQLSDVVRGLVSVIRGDDGIAYFEMLAHDFKLLEIQKLKLLAMKRPGKIRKYSFFMLACFMLMYLTILFIEIMNAFSKLF